MHRWPDRSFALSLLAVILLACPVFAQSPLPLVDEVPFPALRADCQALVKALDERKAPLPPDVAKELKILLTDGAKQPDAAEKIQKLLDARCLCAVSINPESRVKAARGPASAELTRARPAIVLIK